MMNQGLLKRIHGWSWALGRMLLVSVFIESAIVKVLDWHGGLHELEHGGLPASPVLLGLVVVAQVAGGLAVCAGFLTRAASVGLALFLLPATFAFHAFWRVPSDQVEHELVGFFLNVSLIGALLVLAATGPGPVSVDASLQSRKKQSRLRSDVTSGAA